MKFLRRFGDLGINGFMARWYNNNTRRHRLDEMKGYAGEVSRHVNEGGRILEIAPGPGYLAIELARMGYQITRLDISRDFVEIARKNAGEAGVEVEFRQGNAAAVPFADNTFDFIICTAAFKNFKEPPKILREMHRVMEPGCTALIIDMKADISNEEIDKLVQDGGARGMDSFFLRMAFKYFLRKGAYTREGFVDLISKTLFREYEIKEKDVGYYVYLQK
jgi:ubiquinone/menaquinone biosynthesis C-methylase UbiE